MKKLDTRSTKIVESLDGFIGEFEGRGWLRTAATIESVICQIYENSNVTLSASRFEKVLEALSRDLVRTTNH